MNLNDLKWAGDGGGRAEENFCCIIFLFHPRDFNCAQNKSQQAENKKKESTPRNGKFQISIQLMDYVAMRFVNGRVCLRLEIIIQDIF